jgi:hypothetical protein
MEGKKEPREEVSTSAAQGSLGEAGEAVQRAAGQALSRAGDVADDVLAADRHLPNIFERLIIRPAAKSVAVIRKTTHAFWEPAINPSAHHQAE